MKTEIRPAYIHKVDDLANEIQNTIGKIKSHIENENYQLSGSFDSIETFKLIESLRLSSKNGLNRINKSLIRVNRKMTIKSINLFLHHVMKNILKLDNRIKCTISVKEELIQNKRKEWLIARIKADELLLAYKVEKADFYK